MNNGHDFDPVTYVCRKCCQHAATVVLASSPRGGPAIYAPCLAAHLAALPPASRTSPMGGAARALLAAHSGGHDFDATTDICTFCGRLRGGCIVARVGGQPTYSTCAAAPPALAPPTAWGLKPVASASGCEVCAYRGVNPATPCCTYDLMSSQPIHGLGPGFNMWSGPVSLCTACAALQPQSLVGPAAPAAALRNMQAAQQQGGQATLLPYQVAMAAHLAAHRALTATYAQYPEDEYRSPPWPPAAPACDCGAKKTYDAADFSPSHATYCSVAEGKR